MSADEEAGIYKLLDAAYQQALKKDAETYSLVVTAFGSNARSRRTLDSIYPSFNTAAEFLHLKMEIIVLLHPKDPAP